MNHTAELSEIGPSTIDTNEKFQQINILKDISPEGIEPKCTAPIKRFIEEKNKVSKQALRCFTDSCE